MKSSAQPGKPIRKEDAKSPPDIPYTMKLPDGQWLFVEVPGRWATRDRSGSMAFTPEGVKFLDRVRALAMRLERPPTPGHIASLRQALGLTQQEFAKQVGVNKLTVSRWERGTLRPGRRSIEALKRLRRQVVRRGVAVGGT